MKKQKLFNLSLTLIMIAASINAMAIKANAGEANAQGSTDDSSGYSGGSFSPQNQTTNPQIAPDISNFVELKSGQITVPPTVQARVNQVASTVLNQVAIEAINSNDGGNISSSDGDGDKTVGNANDGENNTTSRTEVSPTSVIFAILVRGTNASDVISQVKNALIEAGVSETSVEALINSMLGMINSPSAAFSGIPVAKQLQPAQLVASNKSLAAGYLLAQNSQLNVDINKLNSAINAYNNIIIKSDTKTLKKLAANPEFMAVRNILNQFRTALNQ
ncbi:hypothetical protein [Rivularia sp. UHCC 0363]|uniref:hypothetical protein n=1 Tax=Rivularia sp. UHCC 0363 TaxID=3110244 RepID=UPI002B1F42E0|nr:hypothetical protein [Rivularia sp. UHCC 0363]MEA5593495.1 hypothetical protein [Rivularia sp. UHCC 0363]